MLKNDGSITMQVKYGNSKNFFITIPNSEWGALDLTDSTILFTVKKTADLEKQSETDDTALLQKTIIPGEPELGKFTISITPEDTQKIGVWDFSYDCKIIWTDWRQQNTPLSVFSVLKVSTQTINIPTE